MRADNPLVTYFAMYRSDEAGPVDADEGVSAICLGLFGDYEEAITLARENLAEGYSISINIGVMTQAEWDAIDDVPDDFSPTQAGRRDLSKVSLRLIGGPK